MARRKGNEAERIAQKRLDARLELLLRNEEFKQDLGKGNEMYLDYLKAPGPVYCPPARKDSDYQSWVEQYYKAEKITKRQEMNTHKDRLKLKYAHYLAKWDLNWGPWEYVASKEVDFPSLSLKELKELFKKASAERDKRAERDRLDGEHGPPQMFRLPVLAWDPVERERERVRHFIPADFEPEDGEDYVMPEEELAELVPGQIGKKLTLELNLTFPRDVLEELVKVHLDQLFKRRKQPPTRQRMDKIEDQLRVFDLVKKGLTFPLIRTQFKERPRLSTVKSAYASICRRINSINTSPSSTEPPLNYETHIKTCSICQKAGEAEQFCTKLLQYINQDTNERELASLREPNWERCEGNQRSEKHRRKGSKRSGDKFKEW